MQSFDDWFLEVDKYPLLKDVQLTGDSFIIKVMQSKEYGDFDIEVGISAKGDIWGCQDEKCVRINLFEFEDQLRKELGV